MYGKHEVAYQSSLGFDERSVLSVDLVVKAAGVTQVLAGGVTSPQRSRCCTAVDALSTFYTTHFITLDSPTQMASGITTRESKHKSTNIESIISINTKGSRSWYLQLLFSKPNVRGQSAIRWLDAKERSSCIGVLRISVKRGRGAVGVEGWGVMEVVGPLLRKTRSSAIADKPLDAGL